MEFVGSTIWGSKKYQHKMDDNHVIYCTVTKDSKESVVEFVVGLPGGNSSMSSEEAANYRLGIEGEVAAWTGKHADTVLVNFAETDSSFADFYTENGETIKKIVSCDNKYYMADGNSYYEVTTDAKLVGLDSHEEFVCKDEEHKYLHSNLISEKEKFAKIFLELFETVR